MRKKFFILLLGISGVVQAVKYAKIEGGPLHLIGKIAEVHGTTKETWDIDNVWTSEKSARFFLLKHYFKAAPTPPREGTVYCCKVDSMNCCLHESWLGEISENPDERYSHEVNSNT